MIEVAREEQESLDSLIKRFRRQVTKHKILQEVKQRAFFVSETVQKRLKKQRNERRKKRSGKKRIFMRPDNRNTAGAPTGFNNFRNAGNTPSTSAR